MLNPGNDAPDFTSIDDGDRPFHLQKALKKGPLILYFYPADFTPGCTREACTLRDMHDELIATGIAVFGVSPQSTESHRRFRERYRLPFHLLSDPDKHVIRAYGTDGPLGIGVRRTSYLVNKQGLIAAALNANFRVSEHERFFRQAAETLKLSIEGSGAR
jgi:peroxiredoxin Q/BCP